MPWTEIAAFDPVGRLGAALFLKHARGMALHAECIRSSMVIGAGAVLVKERSDFTPRNAEKRNRASEASLCSLEAEGGRIGDRAAGRD